MDTGFTGGIYEDGTADLFNFAIEGGYMIPSNILEFVAGYQGQEADTYDEMWTRVSFGINGFIKKHDIKIQTTYRIGSNLNGIEDNDVNEFYIQAQYVF